MLWLGALHVQGNFCGAGADQSLQGDLLGTKVGMCCLIRARHAADSFSSCFEEPANETSLGYVCPSPSGNLLNCKVASVSMQAKNEVPRGQKAAGGHG